MTFSYVCAFTRPVIKRNHILRTTTEPDISRQAKTSPLGMTTSETTLLGWMIDGRDIREED